MSELRLISFLPAATEMVYALGLGDRLVGVSHECDFPAAAKTALSGPACSAVGPRKAQDQCLNW